MLPDPINKRSVTPKHLTASSVFFWALCMVYCTAPPMPIPHPEAGTNAVMGYATLIVANAASPIALPKKKPSTTPYDPDNAKANMEGITYQKNSL